VCANEEGGEEQAVESAYARRLGSLLAAQRATSREELRTFLEPFTDDVVCWGF
jgi:hypothetical protein